MGTGEIGIRTPRPRGLRSAGFAVALLAGMVPAYAQDAKTADTKAADAKAPVLKLELNRLEPAGEACRTYLLVDNSRGPALKSLKVDLFAFDTDGVAQKRLAVELGPVQERKTMVRLFDFPALACPKIGRVLLNDVLACEGGDAGREACLERIETESKASAPFVR
ncbi:Tat pathway signal protein [Methylobacterium sp. BTF04]|nr:Tat pathway signal protein [Methylobacterium sp. BTF04]